jgi:ribosomal protein L32
MAKMKEFSKAYTKLAINMALGLVDIYPCKSCGHPVHEGYLCRNCGEDDPRSQGQENTDLAV